MTSPAPEPGYGEAPRTFVRPVRDLAVPYTAPRVAAAMASLRQLNPTISAERADMMVHEITRRMANPSEHTGGEHAE